MKSSRRSIGAGAALTVLLVSASVGGATAADDPNGPPDHAQGQGDERRADRGPHRKKAVEPKGRPASAGEMAAGRVSCGQVITRSTTLTRDVGPCPADGIIIGADNIQLNLNGHTISGTPGVGDGNAAGVRLPFKSGVKITGHPGNSGKKGTVTGFDGGVLVNGGSGNTIENLVIKDNIGPNGDLEPTLADGIALFHSGKNRILNNRLTHNGPYDGIGVLGVDSNDNLLRGNTVENTPVSESPFSFASDGVGIIINNFLDEEGTSRRGEPIRNNDVIDNVIRRNDNSGISNLTNIGARIVGNTVQDNGQAGERCFLFPAPPDCEALSPQRLQATVSALRSAHWLPASRASSSRATRSPATRVTASRSEPRRTGLSATSLSTTEAQEQVPSRGGAGADRNRATTS